MATAQPQVIHVPEFGGAQVPVYGGQNQTRFLPTRSPASTASAEPTAEPTLPPGVLAKELLATCYGRPGRAE